MTTSAYSLLLSVVLLAGSVTVHAQQDMFANPENLQVLPEDISPQELRATMRGFAMATGLRCASCHVAGDAEDFSTYDFPNDEKELKNKARAMLKMVNVINTRHLADFGDDRLQVQCLTCHRGVQKPQFTGQILAEAAAEDGVPGIQQRYRELKEQYYGSHSYDFTEFTLTDFARSRAVAGEMAQARAVLDIVLAEHPDSFTGHFMYGELMLELDQPAEAKTHYLRARQINPGVPMVQQRLDQLEAGEN